MTKTDDLIREIEAIAFRRDAEAAALTATVVARIRAYESAAVEMYDGEREAKTKVSSYMSDLKDRLESLSAKLVGTQSGDVVEDAIKQVWGRRQTS